MAFTRTFSCGLFRHQPQIQMRTVTLTRPVTARDVAQEVGKKPFQVIKDLMSLDFFADLKRELTDAEMIALGRLYDLRFVLESVEEEESVS